MIKSRDVFYYKNKTDMINHKIKFDIKSNKYLFEIVIFVK